MCVILRLAVIAEVCLDVESFFLCALVTLLQGFAVMYHRQPWDTLRLPLIYVAKLSTREDSEGGLPDSSFGTRLV